MSEALKQEDRAKMLIGLMPTRQECFLMGNGYMDWSAHDHAKAQYALAQTYRSQVRPVKPTRKAA